MKKVSKRDLLNKSDLEYIKKLGRLCYKLQIWLDTKMECDDCRENLNCCLELNFDRRTKEPQYGIMIDGLDIIHGSSVCLWASDEDTPDVEELIARLTLEYHDEHCEDYKYNE